MSVDRAEKKGEEAIWGTDDSGVLTREVVGQMRLSDGYVTGTSAAISRLVRALG